MRQTLLICYCAWGCFEDFSLVALPRWQLVDSQVPVGPGLLAAKPRPANAQDLPDKMCTQLVAEMTGS